MPVQHPDSLQQGTSYNQLIFKRQQWQFSLNEGIITTKVIFYFMNFLPEAGLDALDPIQFCR